MASLNEFASLQPLWCELGVKIMGKWVNMGNILPISSLYLPYILPMSFLRKQEKQRKNTCLYVFRGVIRNKRGSNKEVLRE